MIEAIRGGTMTSIQDRGRFRLRSLGIPRSGPMDEFAFKISNLIVGNSEDDACLEFAGIGPKLLFHVGTTIAVYGGEWILRLNDQIVQQGKPYRIAAGSVLTIDSAKRGYWGYLAVRFGIKTKEILGSRSTHLRSHLGGFGGRTLVAGDSIPVADPKDASDSTKIRDNWYVDWPLDPLFDPHAHPIRLLKGSDWEMLDEDNKQRFLSQSYTMDIQSDRMGYRFVPDRCSIELKPTIERLSQPSAVGALQLPPSGIPIVMMADAATVGGYPCIAHVIRADRARLAQLRPGEKLSFECIELEEARRLYDCQQTLLKRVRWSIMQKQL